MSDPEERNSQRILEVAADLLERDGVQGVSTRSVAAAAGIRAASLYRFFEDKDGLLAALAIYGFERYLDTKSALPKTGDPVADMHRGWDAHVDFGLSHPAFYLLMFGAERPGRRPPAAHEAHRQLTAFLDRAAAAGRLRVPTSLAAELMMAAVVGATLALIARPAQDRDMAVSSFLREEVIGSLVTDPPRDTDPGLAARALSLNAALTAAEKESAIPLRPSELALLRDWLHHLAG